MFDNNWNILIALLVIVLVFAYFGNCSEGFGGTINLDNKEAIQNIASVYNKDNITVTNLNANTARINKFLKSNNADSAGVEFLHDNESQGIGLGFNTIYAAGSNPDVNLGLKAKGKGVILLNSNVTAGKITTPLLDLPGAQLSQSDKSPNALNIQYGDGTGWRANFKKWDGNTFASIVDNGSLCLGNTCINEAQLADLLNNTVKYTHEFWIRSKNNRNMSDDQNRIWLRDGNDGTWWRLVKTSG